MNKYQVYWHRVLQLYIHQDETFCPLLLARYNFKWMGKGNAKKDLRCHLWIKFIFSHLLRTISSHLHFYCINLFQVYPCHAHFLNITLQYHLRVHRVGEGAGKERKERMPRKHSRVFIELLFSAVLGISTKLAHSVFSPRRGRLHYSYFLQGHKDLVNDRSKIPKPTQEVGDYSK